MTTLTEIETPSGKGARDENFPVGSLLLPARLRPHVAAFYAFARAIDDIADNPALPPEQKIARLDAMEQAVAGGAGFEESGYETSTRLAHSLAATGVSVQHCRDLASAFRQDAVKLRYRDWDELIDYCDRSAAPVGRYLLDLHGEAKAAYPVSDALCNALQVINHLQDCALDYARLDRVYLPQDWLAAEGAATEALAAPASSAALRRVIDRCLAATRGLLDTADRLPRALSSRRLALESAVIVRIAWRLVDHLARRDPLAERVVLNKPQLLACGVSGVMRGLFGR